MVQMYKSIIFDIDGTLLDTEKAILLSLQQVLKEEGLSYELDDLKFSLGIPGKEALKQLPVTNVDKMDKKWSQAVFEYADEVGLFSDVEEIIELLADKQIQMGIVTSKTRDELKREFEPFGLNTYFQYIVCADDTVKHKPEPEPLLACLEGLGVPSSSALYIGDSIYDMHCAYKAGVHFALALWGAKTTEGYDLAEYVLKKPQDIAVLAGLKP